MPWLFMPVIVMEWGKFARSPRCSLYLFSATSAQAIHGVKKDAAPIAWPSRHLVQFASIAT